MELSQQDKEYLAKKKIEIVDNCPICLVERHPGCICAEQLRWEVEMVLARIPVDARSFQLTDFVSPQTKDKIIPKFNSIIENIANLDSWVFYGGTGTGKTSMGCLLLRELIKRRQRVKYFNSPKDLATYINVLWRNKEDHDYKEFLSTKVLLIDKVGTGLDIHELMLPAIIAELENKLANGCRIILVSSVSPDKVSSEADQALLRLCDYSTLNFETFNYKAVKKQAKQLKERNGH